jgi:hypothetical protein
LEWGQWRGGPMVFLIYFSVKRVYNHFNLVATILMNIILL